MPTMKHDKIIIGLQATRTGTKRIQHCYESSSNFIHQLIL